MTDFAGMTVFAGATGLTPLRGTRIVRICGGMNTAAALQDRPMAEAESLLQFPTAFPIKIMGRHADDFAQTILAIVTRHAPDFDASTLEMRASREGNYLSLTATINAVSREQLDALYRELSAHPAVSIVL